jgi:hypothetical protein
MSERVKEEEFAVVIVLRELEDTFRRAIEGITSSEWVCAYRILYSDIDELEKVLKELHQKTKRGAGMSRGSSS